jgi:glycosyltransferase involved in cell wall biosynthesis
LSGDLWAGAEAQAFTLLAHLAKMPDAQIAAVLLNEGTLTEKLRETGICVHVLDERNLDAVRLYRRLRVVLRNWNPDIVHTHRVKENIIGSVANRLERRVPCLRTVHGGDERSASRGLRTLRQRGIYELDRWCGRVLQQKIVAVSTELGNRLGREYPPGWVVVVENGVDENRVLSERATAEFRAEAPDALHIGIVGRLVQVKRVDLFLRIASLLTVESFGRPLRFHVFGDGPLRSNLENLARQLRIANRVSFHGHRHDIASCIGGLDALIICSDHEGLPMTALEALVLQIPTVAHAVGGLVDVVPEEFLVQRHDPEGYKNQVMRALGEQGRAIAAANSVRRLPYFTAGRNAERVRALYADMIAAHDGTRR